MCNDSMTTEERQAALIEAVRLGREAVKTLRWLRLDSQGIAQLGDVANAFALAADLTARARLSAQLVAPQTVDLDPRGVRRVA